MNNLKYDEIKIRENSMDGECHDKEFVVVNPTRMCQPMGAVQAMMGLKNVMPLIHGSQGCATYMRFQLIRHFREPIEVASTSLNEKTVIYGGEMNLLKALKNISEKQNPEMIGVMSSCLTETIGDDVEGIIRKFEDVNIGEDLPAMVSIPTPSYAGSHVEGYDKAILSLVEYFARKSVPNNKINIILGNLSPSNVVEIKEMMNDLNVGSILLTDTSENLDAPLSEETLELHKFGTSLEELEDTANSNATISVTKHNDSGAKYLEKIFDVKAISGLMPVGLRNTDIFINNVCNAMGIDIPDKIIRDRGRLSDVLVDAHAYNYRRKVAIFGDVDMVIAMARFTYEMGMIPKIFCVGSESSRFKEDLNELDEDMGYKPIALENKDLHDFEKVLEDNPVDIIIGNSYGASIADKFRIPLFRVGFPIFDRIGAQRISFIGYNGGINFVDAITNMILDFYYDEEGYKVENKELSFDPQGFDEFLLES
ncbi:MAG: nitrogenase [Methanobrevibacter sp.]|jgi:nitrogenase molybdenum-iron protein beta chain|nr:nitrogenase [Candidatus Methanovirga aequatorialis]